ELRSKAYAVASTAYALLTLVFAVCFCLLLNLDLIGIMLAQLLAALIASLLCLWMLRDTYIFIFDFKQLRDMLRFSIPLVPAGLAVFVSLYINRLALNYYDGLADVGHFGIGNRIANLASFLILGIQAALTPLIYKNYRDPHTPHQISRLFSWVMAAALLRRLFLSLFSLRWVL